MIPSRDLTNRLTDPLLNTLVLPFAAAPIPLPKTQTDLTYLGSVNATYQALFNEAHSLAEKWHGWDALSLVNRRFNRLVKPFKEKLGAEIVRVFEQIKNVPSESIRGHRYLVEFVSYGSYLIALKIYFLYKPQ